MKILILVNKSWNLINFRKDLIYFLKNKNIDLTLVCEDKNENLYEFEKLGCKVFYIGSNLISNFIQINKLLYSVKPTIVLNFTLKSIFIFTLVNIFFNIKNISTFSGLG